MSTAKDFHRIAMSLEGTTTAPHFDRTAFKVARIYATLAADGLTANLKFTPEEQVLKIALYPKAYSPVTGAWGKSGWTVAKLKELDNNALTSGLETAWRNAQPKPRPARKKS